jgi:tetratricopeptide (TPR) repeat protein
MMMRALILLLATAVLASAQAPLLQIHLKDGRIIAPTRMRRDKDTIIATLDIPGQAGAPGTKGDFGFALTDIATLVFEKPSALDTAPELIAAGKAEEALEKLDPVIKFYEGFRDAPGSWWDEAVPLQIQALFALRREKEAAEEAAKFGRLAADPEIKKLNRIFNAVALTRRGEHEGAVRLYADLGKVTERHELLGLMAVNKGDSLVALGDELKKKGELDKAAVRYEEALLSYLRVPALYPAQKMYLPQALLGAARAYLGFEDFKRARVSIKELKEKFGATPEAKDADAVAEMVDKREKQLADPQQEKVEKPAA